MNAAVRGIFAPADLLIVTDKPRFFVATLATNGGPVLLALNGHCSIKEGFAMVKKALAYVMFLGVIYPLSAAAQDTLARFKGGIGVIGVSSGVGTGATAEVVNRNIVRGVQPAGQIWVIDKLDAKVKTNGRITVKGKGLILGGGNNAGRASGQSVFATLICEAAAPFTERSTTPAGVPLAPNGDFEIDDMLSPPSDCASPMLLIRNAAGLAWFAAGILKQDNDD